MDVDALGPEPGEDLGQEERVLLAVDAPDGDELEPALPGARERLGLVAHVGLADQREPRREHRRPAGRVAGRERVADDHGRRPSREQPEDELEPARDRHRPRPAPAREPVAHVLGKVLTHAEHEREPAAPRDEGEEDGDGIRPEDPEHVEVRHLALDRPDRAPERAENPDEVGHPGVVRQRHLADGLRQHVRRLLGVGSDPAEEHELVHALDEPADEEDERAIRGERLAVAPVDEVGVDPDAERRVRT